MATDHLSDTSDREVINTRMFNTTRERLFLAWTDPEQLAKWWGPKGFANTFHDFDLKPGGDWSFTMHGPNGADYPNYSKFVSIQAPDEIIIDHISPPKFTLVANFTIEETGARLQFRQIFNSNEEVDRLRSFLTNANEENFDRLEALISDLYK